MPSFSSPKPSSPATPVNTGASSNGSTKNTETSKKDAKTAPNNQTKSVVNFFEIYKSLSEEDYAKMTTCSFCQRKFRFTSVLIDHMASHTANVENIVEMKLKIWNNGSKLKCSEAGCKKVKKFAYTLDYTRHRDSHAYEGLQCSVCGAEQSGPAAYATHLKEEHRDHLFSTETHQDDLVPPPAAVVSKKKEKMPEVQETLSPAAPITPSYTDNHQVLTPMSAPPIMTASPQPSALSQPMSPMQQPMSAPPTVEFSEAEFNAAISNMPILEDTSMQRQVSENEDFMNILNDLKDFTQNEINKNQDSMTSNADFNMVQQQPQQMQQQPQPGPQPIILSPRYSPAMPDKSMISGASGGSDMISSAGSPYQDLSNSAPYQSQLVEPPARSPGVIKRNPSFSSEQCFNPLVTSPMQDMVNSPLPQQPSPLDHVSSPLVSNSYPQDMINTGQSMIPVNKEDSSPAQFRRSPDFTGSGSHPSSSTRALLAHNIRRKSRSCSFDSTGGVTDNFSTRSPAFSNPLTPPVDNVPSHNESSIPELHNQPQQPLSSFDSQDFTNSTTTSFDFEDPSLLESLPPEATSLQTSFPPPTTEPATGKKEFYLEKRRVRVNWSN